MSTGTSQCTKCGEVNDDYSYCQCHIPEFSFGTQAVIRKLPGGGRDDSKSISTKDTFRRMIANGEVLQGITSAADRLIFTDTLDEIDRLKAERDEAQQAYVDNLAVTMKLTAKSQKLLEALRFYAADDFPYKGAKARQAIADFETGEK